MGKIYVVATPIGNLSDISERALSILRNVDLIAAEDTRRTLKLLNYFGIKKSVVSNYKHNETERGKELIEQIIREDIDVAVVSDAGTPCISDPGSVIVNMALKNNIGVIAIPGPSAVIAALSASGFNFTAFGFLGFIPRDKKDKEMFFQDILNSQINTLVLFESPNRIIKSLKELSEFIPECELLVINDITKLHERSYRGPVSEVIEELEAQEKSNLGEYTIVIHKEIFIRPEGQEIQISTEALLVDEMIKNNCTLKEAIEIVSNNTGTGKNEVYKASLELKKLMKSILASTRELEVYESEV